MREKADGFWQAVELLAPPVRREIVAYLGKNRAASVTELGEQLHKPWTTLAYHLHFLEEAGILSSSYEKIPHSYGHVYRVNEAELKRMLEAIQDGVADKLLQERK